MKKKLEAELISIAHRILQLKDSSSLSQLQEEARQLYETLAILNFAESHFKGPQPTIGQIKSILDEDQPIVLDDNIEKEIEPLQEIKEKEETIRTPEPKEVLTKKETLLDSLTSNDTKNEQPLPASSVSSSKPEIVIEEINARVSEDLFIPADHVLQEDSFEKEIDSDDNDRPKSINDQLKKEIHIGLNDRLAFIKYLFEGSATDYNRVLSQLGTIDSKNEAEDFIKNMIKPDYNDWKDKEEYEERFMDTVLGKYNS